VCFAVVAVTFAATCEQPATQWRAAGTSVGEVLRYPLGDGRVAYVDTNSQIHVNLTDAETQIVVNRGGAQITGKGDRPLKVLVAGLTMRSGQGEFSVREHGPLAVNVLVAAGSIRLGRPGNRFVQWLRGSAEAQTVVFAGESASAGADGISATRTLSPETLTHKLAWKDGWLWFSDETLAEAIARFNEYNAGRKLILADRRLDHLTIGGRFRPTEPDSFAATLKVVFGVQSVVRSGNSPDITAIYLSADCRRRLLRCDTPLGQ
jgi:transmembrane sensor